MSPSRATSRRRRQAPEASAGGEGWQTLNLAIAGGPLPGPPDRADAEDVLAEVDAIALRRAAALQRRLVTSIPRLAEEAIYCELQHLGAEPAEQRAQVV